MEIYITVCKIDGQREFAVWLRKLKQGFCINLEGWDGEWDERGFQKGGDICTYGGIYTYGWFMLRFDRKQQNYVKQLFFNKKYINFLKKTLSPNKVTFWDAEKKKKELLYSFGWVYTSVPNLPECIFSYISKKYESGYIFWAFAYMQIYWPPIPHHIHHWYFSWLWNSRLLIIFL